MKAIAAGVGVVLGVCVVGVQAEAYSASYDQKVTQGRQMMAGKVTIHDELFRMEATVDGQATVTIRNASGTYTYLPAEGMAMKMAGLNPSQQPVQHAENYQQYLHAQHAERIGAETIDGHPCEIYRFTDPTIQGTITAWVWMEKSFPLKTEIDGPDGKTVVELTNLQLGVAVPETAFQLPADVQVMDMGSMMHMR
ncbi:MAG: hypothetical protein HY599_02360 [Candidatus Omnitrophica bacterium]|nr:hypothetical protein [Candidatus Omnitrophota bacterium]